MVEACGMKVRGRFAGRCEGRWGEFVRFLDRGNQLVLRTWQSTARDCVCVWRTKESKGRTEGGQANGPGFTREKRLYVYDGPAISILGN